MKGIESSLRRYIIPPKATNPRITPALASSRSVGDALLGLAVVDDEEEGVDGSMVPDVEIVGLAGSSWDG